MDGVPIDYTSEVGLVRVLIPDTDQIDQNDSGELSFIFSDAQIQAFLALHARVEGAPTVHIKRAAADAIDALGTSEAYVSKVIKTEAKGMGIPVKVLMAHKRLRDLERQKAKVVERLEDEDAESFEQVADALGEFAMLPLGMAALAEARRKDASAPDEEATEALDDMADDEGPDDPDVRPRFLQQQGTEAVK